MSDQNTTYEPLDVDTIPSRLGSIAAITKRLGTDASQWTAREVGDGNLNFVFIVTGPKGSVIVKQALPYVRLVGESWPLPLSRAFYEYHALTRQGLRDPQSVPEVFHFDEAQALIVMEYLTPHIILRYSLIGGNRHEGLGRRLGEFCARTLFRGSDLAMDAADRKADLALFAGNGALCDITENLVFSDPYFDAEMNRHTTPQLDRIVATLRADIDLKVEVQHLKAAFCANAETMLHGDLHTGSVMVAADEAIVIDPEFVTYGPMGFDIGMLISNFFMAYYAQPGHASKSDDRTAYQDWILEVTAEIHDVFTVEFSRLWREERTGILYPKSLYEDQGHAIASEQALGHRLNAIWRDCLGFAGIEMHRRILGLAHNADFETIENENLRAECEARALVLGRQLVINRGRLNSMAAVFDLAKFIGRENLL
ncbi:5-methylthioribose kinase [hydrothermal vent metagenome]|uniref:S-methyl-5-thioribose kinase n=1 Tax=hydrothermal vent metagenome TaxID=652676 RepID=A0A3B0T686_9ZZZZ